MYLARDNEKGMKPSAVKVHKKAVYANSGRCASHTTMPAIKAPRHMSPAVCRLAMISVLVCLSCNTCNDVNQHEDVTL